MLPFSDQKYYTEPLVDIDLLISLFVKHKFELRQKGNFSEFLNKYKSFDERKFKSLDEADKNFISLYYYLSFFKKI